MSTFVPGATGDAGRRTIIERAAIRRQLATDTAALYHVLADPPACINDVPLWEVIGWARYVGRDRLAALNEAAIADGINLAKRCNWASANERAWVAENAFPRRYR